MKSSKILVIGSNTDMTVKSPALPKPGETIIGGDFLMGPGGKGAYQAVAAKRLGRHRSIRQGLHLQRNSRERLGVSFIPVLKSLNI